MNRIAPIRSLLSDYLKTKTVTRTMHNHRTKDSFDVFERYSPSDGIEYCGVSAEDPTAEFFLQMQEFYEDRNEFPTYGECQAYYEKRERIEIRNNFDEIIEIRKEKSERAFPLEAYDNSVYKIKHQAPMKEESVETSVKSEKEIEEEHSKSFTLNNQQTKKIEWLLREENQLYRDFFMENEQETRQHMAIYNKTLKVNAQTPKIDLPSQSAVEKAKRYERHCVEGSLDSWLKHVEKHSEPLTFVYRNENTTINYNTPRLLLGRFYNESDIGDRKVYHQQKMRFVVCRFSDMILLLKSVDFVNISEAINDVASIIAQTISQQNKKVNNRVESALLFGFPLMLLDNLNLLQHQMQYAVLWALLIRLWVAHEEMNIYQQTHPKHTLRLQLFIDSHISICQYILRTRHFDDANLLDPSRNNDSVAICAVQQYYPNDRDFAYAGNLPNLTECMFVGNLYYDVRPKPKTVALSHALIHIFACKTQPQKCQIRNFVNILHKYVLSFPMIGRLYREIVRVSLLGNYEHATIRPHFEMRMQIYEESNPKNYNELDFFHWMVDNDKLLFQITKEFHLFTVQLDMTVDDLMQENNPSWRQIKDIICASTDICRLILKTDMLKRQCFMWKSTRELFLSAAPESFEQTREWKLLMQQIQSNEVTIESEALFTTIIQDQMTFMHNQSKQISCTKLKKGSYLDVISTYTEGFFETRIINQRSTIKHNSEMIFEKSLLERINLIARVLIHKHSTGELKDGRVQLFYLKAFGVNRQAYHIICKLQYLYENFDLPDNAVTKYLKFLYDEHERDFHLFHVFLRAIIYHRMFRRHALPLDYYLSQRRAILAKAMKMPWEDMDPDDDIYYYCPSCKKFKNPISDMTTNHSPKNMYGQGCENVIYDILKNKLYCTKNSIPLSIKKAMDSGLYDSNACIADKQLAKMIRKHKETVPCCETELVAVHMCGWIQQLEKRKWIICSICAQPMIYEMCKFGPLGVTCGMHDLNRHNDKQNQYTNLSKHSLEYQIRLSRMPLPIPVYNDDYKPENVDYFHYLKSQIGFERQKNYYLDLYKKNFCFYCKCQLTFKSSTKSTSKNLPMDYANPICLIEDRSLDQIYRHEFRDPLFDDVAPIQPSSSTNTAATSNENSSTKISNIKQVLDPLAHWNFTKQNNFSQFRAINVYLCAKDYKKIAYALEDNYIRTTTQFLTEMQKINDYAFKRQQKIQSRAYGFLPR
jgi:hypothetical protein